MNYIALYFLVGAIVAIWTAINHQSIEFEGVSGKQSKDTANKAMLAAYIIIALAWPLSVIVSIYSVISSLLAHPHGQ